MIRILSVLIIVICIATAPQCIAEITSVRNISQIDICFSPGGNCTSAIVKELDAARSEILVQAYSFTSAPIAAELDLVL